MNGESANKFISALVKSLQTLCHGYVEFNDDIEIIGHLYLNIDSGASFDYVVKEKVCKNAENSTVFVSKSFQAQAPPEECITRKDRDDDPAVVFEDHPNMSPTSGTTRLQSAITSISNVLSGGTQESLKPRLLDHSSHHPSPQNTGKRKREHNGNFNSMQSPYKYTTLQTSSSSSSSYFSSGLPAKQEAGRNHSDHFSSQSHAEFFGGDSNQSSGMGPDDDDDLDLDVTFVKEEYESQRNSGQRGVSAGTASRLSQDPSSNQSNLLHDGTSASGSLGYSSSHPQAPQQFASGSAGDIGSINQSFQDSSQVDIGQHSSQGPPNPRSEASPQSRQLDTEYELPAIQPLKLEGMTSMSDTLQLGIKLFGPKFVADMASGDLDLPPPSSDLLNENERDMSESANASVFPDMFDMTAVSTSSIKPSHKLLWHDRKDKLRRSSMMRKASLSKFRNKGSGKKAVDFEVLLPTDAPKKCVKKILDNNGSLDLFGMPYRRKRGRPPKRLKSMTDSEYPAVNIEHVDQEIGGSVGDIGKIGSEKNKGRELGMVEGNSLRSQLSLQEVASIKSLSGSEGYSRRIRGSYRQYSAADKLEIVDFGIKYGSTAASRKYTIPESTVRSWTKKMDTFLMQMNMCNPSALENNPPRSLIGTKDFTAYHVDHPQSSYQTHDKNNVVGDCSVTQIPKNLLSTVE